MSGVTQEKEEIHRHSGWWIPLVLLAAVLLLSGLMLGWYLRPGLKTARPSAQSNLVQLHVQGVALSVPANYLETEAARAGGAHDSVTLIALFPSFHGYSDDEADLFTGNAPDQPVIRITLRDDANSLDAAARLARIYGPYLATPAGHPGAFGLTHYGFRGDSGYAGSELFAGQGSDGLALYLCEKDTAALPSPNCIAIDRSLARGISYSYRFKRAYLARWREMSAGVHSLLMRFRKT